MTQSGHALLLRRRKNIARMSCGNEQGDNVRFRLLVFLLFCFTIPLAADELLSQAKIRGAFVTYAPEPGDAESLMPTVDWTEVDPLPALHTDVLIRLAETYRYPISGFIVQPDAQLPKADDHIFYGVDITLRLVGGAARQGNILLGVEGDVVMVGWGEQFDAAYAIDEQTDWESRAYRGTFMTGFEFEGFRPCDSEQWWAIDPVDQQVAAMLDTLRSERAFKDPVIYFLELTGRRLGRFEGNRMGPDTGENSGLLIIESVEVFMPLRTDTGNCPVTTNQERLETE